MEKFVIFLLLLLGSACETLKSPVGSNNPVTVHGYLKDTHNSVFIDSGIVNIMGETGAIDRNGYFTCTFSPNSKDKFLLFVFPYKPIELNIRDYHQLNAPATIELKLPLKLLEYFQILKKAQNNGYKIISVQQWNEGPAIADTSKVLIMRHDVDFDILIARAFSYIEHQVGVNSTYYFRWSTADENTIRYVKSQGHEVGLHYETLATYCKEHFIYDKKEITGKVIEECKHRLIEEIVQFEKQFGDIYSISSHGEDLNISLKVPNFILVQGQNLDELNVKICGSLFERQPQSLQIFVADSGGKWKPISVQEAINQGHHRIYCLIHPVWWRENP